MLATAKPSCFKLSKESLTSLLQRVAAVDVLLRHRPSSLFYESSNAGNSNVAVAVGCRYSSCQRRFRSLLLIGAARRDARLHLTGKVTLPLPVKPGCGHAVSRRSGASPRSVVVSGFEASITWVKLFRLKQLTVSLCFSMVQSINQ